MDVVAWIAAVLLAVGLGAQGGDPARKLETARELKQRGASAEAAKAYQALLPEVRASGDRKLLAQALLEAGQASLAAGDYPGALDRGREAGPLFHTFQDWANEASAENLAGSAEVYRGNYPAAIVHYQHALDLDRRLHDAKGEINRLNNIAGAFFFQGKYLDALEDYQAALRRAEESRREPWGANRHQMALTNLAVLYEQLGQNQNALEYYRQALAGKSALEPAEHGQLLSNAGTLYRRLGDAVKALETYREAQALFAREHHSAFEIHVLQNVGIVLALDMHDLRGAEQAFTEALDKAQATANRRETVLAHLFRGESYLRAARWGPATADFTAALDGARATGGSEEQWTALYGLARIQRQAGRPKEALATLREAIGVIEAVRSGLGTSSLKAEFLGNKRDVYDAAIGLTMEAGTSEPESLFHLFEQARARNLQDALRGARGQVSLKAVQSRLGESLLLEYWIGDGKRALFWATRNTWGAVVRAWSEEDEARLSSVVAALRNGGEGWREQAGKLGGELFGGVPEATRALPMVIVPDGVLYQVPFEAFPSVPGGPLLIEKAAVSYLPSAALLLRDLPRTSYLPPWRRQWVGFGDPLLAARRALTGDEQWARLPQSARELNGVAHALPGRTTIHAGAADLKRYLFGDGIPGTPLLHFATHAVADTVDPNRSRIFFTREPGSQGSEYLFRPEVQGLRLDDTDLITLSACDTEAGKMVRGEGVQSFSRSFLAAGARSTVTTLWSVEDRATADFMEIFYRHLAAGEAKAEALRAAKLSFLHQNGVRSHPRYWAAFVLNGNGQQPIRPVVPWTWIAAPSLAIAGLVTVFFRRRHRLLHHLHPTR
jgi:tetratricopeptide (TPR) repeat protein